MKDTQKFIKPQNDDNDFSSQTATYYDEEIQKHAPRFGK